MLRLFAKVEPTPVTKSPFRIVAVSQYENDARLWAKVDPVDSDHDIVIVDFPEYLHQDALDFIAWIRFKPLFMDVMTALAEDKIMWRMWSIEYGPSLKTPINDQDRKFLKSLRVSWSEEKPASDQSGLHLV